MVNVERNKIDKSSIAGLPIVWIVGGPGSGKGTQCENITLKYGYTHISSGDLLRAEVMSGTTRGGQLYKLMSGGEQVPDDVVDDIIAEGMVAKAGKSKGFLIDGYPISVAQAEAFEKDVGEVKVVVYLEANNDVLSKRLFSRNNFDDTPDSIKKRIEHFNAKTLPILEKYASKVKKINAERPKEEIFADIKKLFDEL